MSVLELQDVHKRYRRGSREVQALRGVSLELHSGEMVGIWGHRHSGRSTLLRVAAGIERADEGRVCAGGLDLARADHAQLVGGPIGYCDPGVLVRQAHRFGAAHELVIGTLMVAQVARGLGTREAKQAVLAALARTGAEHCADLRVSELDGGEAVRVTLAHALSAEPMLLLIDEPTNGVDLLERDPILALLRSLANEGLAILTCVGETTGLFGVDRALALSVGELRGDLRPGLAPVVALTRRLSA